MSRTTLIWLFPLLSACEPGAISAPDIELTEAPDTNSSQSVTILQQAGGNQDDIHYLYSWLKDGELQVGHTEDTVAASHTSKGETWEVVVLATDGLTNSPATRESTTILNLPPRVETVTLSPEAPQAGDLLQVLVDFTDEDEDPVNLTYTWYIDDEEDAEWSESYYPAENTTKDMVVQV